MKKRITLVILLLSIAGVSYVGFSMFKFAEDVKKDAEQYPIIEFTEFKNGRWISESDSLAGLEIKDGKMIMFYKGYEIDSTDIYDIYINREYITALGTEHKPFEFLRLTNATDTLEYSILGYSNTTLSLMYLQRGNLLIYEPEK